VESNGRPDNPPFSTSQAGEGICTRCTSCGEVTDQVILWNRLNPTLSLLHVVRQRKYAQQVDHGESDGQDRDGQVNDRHPDV
jgi:hypothetical protein